MGATMQQKVHPAELAADEIYLTPSEVSERYRGKIKVRTLANWRSSGKGGPPYTKLGGKVAYPLSLLIEWEARRTFSGTSEYR